MNDSNFEKELDKLLKKYGKDYKDCGVYVNNHILDQNEYLFLKHLYKEANNFISKYNIMVSEKMEEIIFFLETTISSKYLENNNPVIYSTEIKKIGKINIKDGEYNFERQDDNA